MTFVQNRESREGQGGAGLLISILLRYPEVGSIRLCQESHALQFTFLAGKVAEEDTSNLETSIPEALELYHRLEREKMLICSVHSEWTERVGTITVLRDVETMSQNEIGLIVELVRRECAGNLFCESAVLEEDEMLYQEELISHMLADLPVGNLDANVMAVREEGKVMIFNR